MKEHTRKLLDKAARAADVAKTLLKQSDVDFAASRAYYSMFYVAEALLNEKGLRFRKHGGVHGAFGDHFIKTGLLDPKFHRWLLDAFDKRIQGDYGVEAAITEEDVEQLISQAGEFLREAQRRLE